MTPDTKACRHCSCLFLESLKGVNKSEGSEIRTYPYNTENIGALSFCVRKNVKMCLYAFLDSSMAYNALENSPWMTFLNVEAKKWG